MLRRALALAVKWEMATRNVADLVDGPKVEHHEVKPPTLDQVLKIFDVLKGDKFEALFTVCLALGLRRGETLGLRWKDVNFENQEISIKQALQRSGGKYSEGEDQRSKLRLVSPKSNRGIRTIAMPNCVASALRNTVHAKLRRDCGLDPNGKITDLYSRRRRGHQLNHGGLMPSSRKY